MSKFNNLIGKRFGRLVVVDRASNLNNKARWLCKCDCGGTTISHSYSLTSGRTRSCGCYSRENLLKIRTKHGFSKTHLFHVWSYMKVRCYNEKYEHYDCYGGRGIKIRDEWREDFVSFKDWALENGYRDDLEIERIDVDGDYTPSNCTWETRERQVLNRRNTLYLINPHTHEIKPLMDWCRLYDFKYKLAWARHNKGKSFDDIFLPLQSHI